MKRQYVAFGLLLLGVGFFLGPFGPFHVQEETFQFLLAGWIAEMGLGILLAAGIIALFKALD